MDKDLAQILATVNGGGCNVPIFINKTCAIIQVQCGVKPLVASNSTYWISFFRSFEHQKCYIIYVFLRGKTNNNNNNNNVLLKGT